MSCYCTKCGRKKCAHRERAKDLFGGKRMAKKSTEGAGLKLLRGIEYDKGKDQMKKDVLKVLGECCGFCPENYEEEPDMESLCHAQYCIKWELKKRVEAL